ncbi:MAG TPA: NAD(P)H-hydrate epimerase, partial [Actinomycetota bacterium]|nr:NAD(P)H-hydrate epimerase [Actinomycetota bacterium]
MKPVLTPAAAAALDRASQERGVRAEDLMERAGAAVARAAVGLVGGAYGRRAVVVCGKGNNGGDGLVAARRLARLGVRPAVLLLAPPETLSGPAARNLGRLAEVGVRPAPYSAPLLERELARADVAVDAIFGTGFRGRPEGDAAEAIALLNGSGVPVVAVDIPSGVDGETGAVPGEAVRAAVTVTFGAEKAGVVFLPGAEHAGVVEVADIGFPPDLVASEVVVVERADVAALLPARPPGAHKRSTGVVLVVGGSRRMTGAVRLVAEAAYRSGAGLVTVAAPEGTMAALQAGLAEPTYLPLPETEEGIVAPGALDRVLEALPAFDAVAVGPGLTADPGAARVVEGVVRESPVPVVLDADGLNAFAGRAADAAVRRAEAVLTPHAGECARLLGTTAPEVGADRLGSVRKLAALARAVALLKGPRTLVASPEGEVRVNP